MSRTQSQDVAGALDVSQPAFGQRLRQFRLERRMAQRELAGTQVTASYISLLEAGQRVPTLNVAIALARRLEVPLETLLGPEAGQFVTVGEAQYSPSLTLVQVSDANDIGDHEQARKLLEEALAQARREGGGPQFIQLGLSLQDVLHGLNEHEARLAILDEMLELGAVKASPPTEMSLMTTKASALREAGKLVEARQVATAAMLHAKDPGVLGRTEHARLLGVLISVLCELGELDQVESLVEELLRLAKELGRPSITGRANWAASMAYAVLGKSDEAYENLRAALDTLAHPSMSFREWLRFCRAVVSTLLDLERDLDLANEWLRSAEAAVHAVNLSSEGISVQALRARYELLVGNAERALELYDGLDDEAAGFPVLKMAQLRIGKARALRLLGRSDEAVRILREAANLCEQGGAYQMAVQLWRQVDELIRAEASGAGNPSKGDAVT